MVNPGSFRGMRREFLDSEKAAYADAVKEGYVADALALIHRRYFKRFPIDLPHDEDPSPESLADVDDEAPDPEIEAPCESLGPEEYAAALKARRDRSALIVYRKAQIKRWMAYQYMKDNDIDPKESGAQNPYTILLHKLTGTSSTKPRLRNPANVWAKTHGKEIQFELTRRMVGLEGDVARRQQVGVRGQVMRDLYNALPDHQKRHWKRQAQQEHEENLTKWKKEMEGDPSTQPADRQRCIQGLVRFSQPILDAIAAATGFKVTMIAGGPEPADGGRLNIISVHSGTTGGDIKVNFGRAERKRYKQQIVPIFGQFLKTCYTPEECRSRALPMEEGFDSVQRQSLESEGATFDAVDPGPAPQVHLDTATNGVPQPATDADHRPSNSPEVPIDTSADHAPPPVINRNNRPANSVLDATAPVANAPSRAISRSLSRSISRALESPPHSLNPSPRHSREASPTHAVSQSRVPSPIHPRPGSPNRSPVRPPRGSVNLSAPSLVKSTRATRRKNSVTNGADTNAQDEASEARPPSFSAARNSKRQRPAADSALPPAKRRRAAKITSTTSSSTVDTSTVDTSTVGTSTVDTSDSYSPFEIPANSPAWFRNATSMFNTDSLGPRWLLLAQTWALFEMQEGFRSRGNLRATGRPQAVSHWIQRARSSTWQPKIDNVKVYERIHCRWWKLIQPKVEGDWQELRLPGANGILSVLASLFYWGSAARMSGMSRKKWESAVEDCMQVFSPLPPS